MQFTREEDEWAKFFGKARSFDAGIFFKEEFENISLCHVLSLENQYGSSQTKRVLRFGIHFDSEKKNRSFRDGLVPEWISLTR